MCSVNAVLPCVHVEGVMKNSLDASKGALGVDSTVLQTVGTHRVSVIIIEGI